MCRWCHECSAQVTLDSCRHMALRNNKQMSIEQLKIEQAGYQRKQAQAAYKPSIDFAGTYVSLKAKERLAESFVELVTSLDNDVKKMLEQGVTTRATLLSVDVKVNEANVALTKVRNGLVLSRMALAQLCGEPLDEPMILADENRTDLGVDMYPREIDMRQVYNRRNDYNALSLGVKVYDEKAKVARSEMLPTIAAMGSVFATNPHVYNGFKREFGVNYALGAVIKIPIVALGRLEQQVQGSPCRCQD